MAQNELDDNAGTGSSPRSWPARLFVPLVTLILVIVGGHWAAAHLDIDLLTAAQNERLTFQPAQGGGVNAELTPQEIEIAEKVLDHDRTIPPGQSQLLYVGNSQTMAIMDRQPGDLTTPQWVGILLHRKGAPVQVRLGSMPNMTCGEMLVALASQTQAQPRKADAMIAGLVLEEFRGVGIRSEVEEVARQPDVLKLLHEMVDGNPDLPSAGKSLAEVFEVPQQNADDEKKKEDRPALVRADEAISDLAQNVPLIAKRDKIVGYLLLCFAEARNKALHITSSSPRPVPEPLYRANMELLELMFRYAKQKQIPLFVYLAPIRPVQPNPNLAEDVARFRRDVPPLAARYGVHCVDYNDAIPEKLWTNYDDFAVGTAGQRDFAHFTGAAHKLLAQTIMNDVGAELAALNSANRQAVAR